MKLNLRGDYVKKKIAKGHSPGSKYIQQLKLIEYGIISKLFGYGLHSYTGWAYEAAKGRYSKEYDEIEKEIYCE